MILFKILYLYSFQNKLMNAFKFYFTNYFNKNNTWNDILEFKNNLFF